MLAIIRDKHMKKILWGLVIIIVPAFVLLGSFSALKGRDRNVIAVFNNKKIKSEEFRKYMSTAYLYILMNMPESNKVTENELRMLAVDFIILLGEAKKENIQVADSDIIDYIKLHPLTANFFVKGQKFESEAYAGFLKRLSQYYKIPLNPPLFEGYVRSFVTIERLLNNNVNVSVSDDEMKALWIRENQKAKIAYLFIPHEKFKVDIGVSESELAEFFEDNPNTFTRDEKIKLQYILIDKDRADKADIEKAAAESTKLSELSDKFSLEIKETDFIGMSDPIQEIGWEPQVNIVAFSLEEGTISSPIETQKKIIIIQPTAKNPRHTPALDEIHAEVKAAYVFDMAKKQAKTFSQDLLDKINKDKDKELKTFAQKDYAEFKETDFFGYSDYIEGLGLNQPVNEKIFSLDTMQIYSEPLLLATGFYIVQLVEKTPIDENDFNSKKNKYMIQLRQAKVSAAKENFINTVRQKSDFTLMPGFTQ
jgi:parvulin-like peptidyl-prolyl isomerase